MLRQGLVLAILLASCKHTAETSSPKSLLYVPEKTLISKTLVDASKEEPLPLVVDGTTGKPTPNAKFFVGSIILTIQEPGSEAVCARKLKAVETRGHRGIIPYILIDHEEDANSFIYGNKLNVVPVAYNELLLSFEKNEDPKISKQCEITVVADGHWADEGDIGYSFVSDNPKRDAAIREYGSTSDHRMTHYMWHTSRGVWWDLTTELEGIKATNLTADASSYTRGREIELEKIIGQYKSSGWAPPRYFRQTDLETARTGAGEDFLYMHHQMLGRVGEFLKSRGFAMVEPWTELPKPNDEKFPLGPTVHEPFTDMKGEEYFYATQNVWEKAYKSPKVDVDVLAKELLEYRLQDKTRQTAMTLEEAKVEVELLLEPRPGLKFTGVKGISLGEYGHLLEETIHNNLHTRYAYDSASRPADADPLDRETWEKDWSEAFDPAAYDWLGDTYSSHVHPWFYRIHGWIDARIQTWLDANDFKSIGTKDECAKAPQPCYVWLSDSRYVDKGSDLPWEGPVVADSSSNTKQSSGQSKMSLHAHKAPVFTRDVIQATRGLRARYASMNRILINPKLLRKKK